MQNTSHIFLVRPSQFGFNHETAKSNAFQNEKVNIGNSIAGNAILEFNVMAETLRNNGIQVTIFDDTIDPVKPDAVFPNNWITMHADGRVFLFPMEASNRRLERRHDIVENLKQNFVVKEVVDLSKHESDNRFLEGTGSIIFDHNAKTAYACLSPRTDKDLLIEFCNILGYTPVSFHSNDKHGKAIYHTNVMMCIGEKFCVICLESIVDPIEREMVVSALQFSGHEIIDISLQQVEKFAGNMLELKNLHGDQIVALSESAFNALSQSQKDAIGYFAKLVPLPIQTIETIGGGSARCMIAEIFLPVKK